MALLRSLDDQIRIRIEEGNSLLLGRLPECDIYLEDPSVSSQHAQLKLDQGILQLVDLGSTNGTRINYSQVEGPTLVLDGDTIEFGKVSFTVDGPELMPPEEAGVDPKAMTSLEPLDTSEPLDNTMHIGGVEEELGSGEPAATDETPPRKDSNPVTTAFGVALVLLLIAGALILLGISRITPSF